MAKSKKAKKANEGVKKNGKSLADIVQGILGRARDPMRVSEVAKMARPIWTKAHGEPAKRFDGMVWHAVQASGTQVAHGLYKLAPEGKSESVLHPIGTRNEGKPKKGKGKKAAKAAKPAKASKAKPKRKKAPKPEPAEEPEEPAEDEDEDEDEDEAQEDEA